MKNIHYLLLLTLLMTLSACVHNKESYLADFEKFVDDVEAKKSISADEMKVIKKKFTTYSEKYYDKFKDSMTGEELEQVTQLQIRYYAALAKKGFNEIMEQLQDFGKKAVGVIEELLN